MKRFWDKVNKEGPIVREGMTPCWEWTAGCFFSKCGSSFLRYGCFRLAGKMRKAHRVSWELMHGPIPQGGGYHGTCVCHKCDNTLCVNPEHLFLGSHERNMVDRNHKDRHSKGVHRPQSKLKDEDALKIIEMYGTGVYSQRELAALFGIHSSTISRITTHKRWKHV